MDSIVNLYADLGDYLYIIIFAILMLVGLFEKITKARQPPVPPPVPSDVDDDDFNDVEEQQPQTLEDLMRRMMQTVEPQQEKEPLSAPSVKDYYTPIVQEFGKTPSDNRLFFPDNKILLEEDVETNDFEFNIRQAIISNEILNRKY